MDKKTDISEELHKEDIRWDRYLFRVKKKLDKIDNGLDQIELRQKAEEATNNTSRYLWTFFTENNPEDTAIVFSGRSGLLSYTIFERSIQNFPTEVVKLIREKIQLVFIPHEDNKESYQPSVQKLPPQLKDIPQNKKILFFEDRMRYGLKAKGQLQLADSHHNNQNAEFFSYSADQENYDSDLVNNKRIHVGSFDPELFNVINTLSLLTSEYIDFVGYDTVRDVPTLINYQEGELSKTSAIKNFPDEITEQYLRISKIINKLFQT